MTNRDEDRFKKMRNLLIQAIEMVEKANKTDDEDLEEKYIEEANALYEAYEKMKAESEPDAVEAAEKDLRSMGMDEVTINEIRYLSRMLGVSMTRTVIVLLCASVNHVIKTGFEPTEESHAGEVLDFMQIVGVSPEGVRKALKKMTSDEI